MGSHGQAGAEMVIILGVALVVLSLMWFLNQERYSDFQGNVQVANAKNNIKKLTDAVDFVYRQGDGARTRIYFDVPETGDIIIYTTQNGTGVIEFVLRLNNEDNSIFGFSRANLTGEIPNATGSYCIDVIAQNGLVNVTRSTGSC